MQPIVKKDILFFNFFLVKMASDKFWALQNVCENKEKLFIFLKLKDFY